MFSGLFGKSLPKISELTKVDDKDAARPDTYLKERTYYISNKGSDKIVEELKYTGVNTITIYNEDNTAEQMACISNEISVLPFEKLLIAELYSSDFKYYPDEDSCKNRTPNKHYKQKDYSSNYDFYYKENPTPTGPANVKPTTGGKRAKSRRQKQRTRKTRKHRKPSKK